MNEKLKIGIYLLGGILFGFLVSSLFQGFTPLDNPKICMTIEPNYMLTCYSGNQEINVQSSESNLQKALDNPNYNCSVSSKFDTYNFMNCSQTSNYTKYQMTLSKELPSGN